MTSRSKKEHGGPKLQPRGWEDSKDLHQLEHFQDLSNEGLNICLDSQELGF